MPPLFATGTPASPTRNRAQIRQGAERRLKNLRTSHFADPAGIAIQIAARDSREAGGEKCKTPLSGVERQVPGRSRNPRRANWPERPAPGMCRTATGSSSIGRRSAASPTPTSAPATLARNSTSQTCCQPRNAPIMASIFTSPSPMASTPLSRNQTQRTAEQNRRAERGAECTRHESRRHPHAERDAGHRCPGYVKTFGSRCVSRSVPNSATSSAVNTSRCASSTGIGAELPRLRGKRQRPWPPRRLGSAG